VKDLEQKIERQKRGQRKFEKFIDVISKEWLELESAFETILSDLNVDKDDDDEEEDKKNERSNGGTHRKRLDAFRELLLRNLSEEDERAFEAEVVAKTTTNNAEGVEQKKKRKRMDDEDYKNKTTAAENKNNDEGDDDDDDDQDDQDDEDRADKDEDDEKFLKQLKERAQATKERFAKALKMNAMNKNTSLETQQQSLMEKKVDYFAADALRAKKIANCLRATKAKMEEKLKENEEVLELARMDVTHLRRRIAILESKVDQDGGVDEDLGIKLPTAQDAKMAGAKAQLMASDLNGQGGGSRPATPGLPQMSPIGKASGSAETDKQISQLKADLVEADGRFKMSEKLLAEMREKNEKLENDLKSLRVQHASGAETLIIQSPLYTALSQKFEILKTESKIFDQTLEQTKKENDVVKTRNVKLEIEARNARAREEKLVLAENYSKELKSFLERANRERDEAERKNSEKMASSGPTSQKPNTEESAMKLLDVANAQLKTFKSENERLVKARTERDEVVKQNRDFETKIKSLEAQVSTLEKKAASKSKTLEIDLAAKTAELLQEIENRSKAEQDVLDKTAEIEAFVDEIESLATMADDATGQCDEILKKLSTTEDEVVNLQKETAAARREAKKYYDDYEQVRMSNEKDKAEALSALERLQLLTEDVEKLTKELESAKAEARGVTGAGSSDRIKIEQLEADITRLNSQLSIVEKRCNQLSLDEVKIQKELKKLTEERDALKIDQAGLKKKCDRLSREGGAGLMQDEINAYKTMLGCHVCKQRDKACVITKCFHMFCRECIDTRIATRQRKCPGCALPFSETDVQNIYF
jgi:E3 ubiquitin-protein ligase BRE1